MANPPRRMDAAGIPGYDTWMKQTALGTFQMRSSQMRAIDSALKSYWERPGDEGVRKLRRAVSDWIRYKGDAWQSSERNKTGLISQLRNAVYPAWSPPATPEEIAARKFVEQNRKMMIRTMFQGKRVRIKKVDAYFSARESLGQLKGAVGQLRGQAQDAGGGMIQQELEKLLTEVFGAALSEVKSYLMHVLGADVVAQMVPVFGYFKRGKDAIVGWGRVAKSVYDKYDTRTHRYAVLSGDPMLAFVALEHLLQGQIHENIATASLDTLAFTVDTLLSSTGVGATASPIIGAANTLAKLTQKIVLIGLEYRQTRMVNQLLTGNKLDFHLFEAYPLMGCYVLACSTLSDILNMAVSEWGNPGWMDDVELLKTRHIDPVREKCFKLIDASPFEIEGLTPLFKPNSIYDKIAGYKEKFDRVETVLGDAKTLVTGA